MSVFTASAVQGGPLLRGMPTRITDLMEQFQTSIIRAIAATAGCNVSVPEIDNGIDMQLTHSLQDEEDATLNLQLKAVSNGWNTSHTAITAKMTRKRFERMSRPNPSLNSIVVIMDLPANQEDWLEINQSSSPFTHARHCCYWVNLAGAAAPSGTGDIVTVTAPVTNIFDDQSLCVMMDKIRAGGAP